MMMSSHYFVRSMQSGGSCHLDDGAHPIIPIEHGSNTCLNQHADVLLCCLALIQYCGMILCTVFSFGTVFFCVLCVCIRIQLRFCELTWTIKGYTCSIRVEPPRTHVKVTYALCSLCSIVV